MPAPDRPPHRGLANTGTPINLSIRAETENAGTPAIQDTAPELADVHAIVALHGELRKMAR